MLFRSDNVRHKFPLRAAYPRRSLPHANGPTVSEYYEPIRLPTRLRSLSLSGQHPYLSRPIHHDSDSGLALYPGFPFVPQQPYAVSSLLFCHPGTYGVSQVLDASLVTCHGLRTPTAFHDLACTGRFPWTSRSLTRSSTATCSFSGHCASHSRYAVTTMACNLLCVRFTYFVRNVYVPLSTHWCTHYSLLRHRRNTQYGWVASPYPTGTFTLQDAPIEVRLGEL